jgi:hypothetical protein
MDTPAACWSVLLLARGSRTCAIGGLGRGRSAPRRSSASSFAAKPSISAYTLAIVMISISVVSLLMTVADRQLRTAPVWVKDSISSDKPTGAPSINMTELRPKELTP